jgi:TRAP-type uncharacterized transport system fused permease subunit
MLFIQIRMLVEYFPQHYLVPLLLMIVCLLYLKYCQLQNHCYSLAVLVILLKVLLWLLSAPCQRLKEQLVHYLYKLMAIELDGMACHAIIPV